MNYKGILNKVALNDNEMAYTARQKSPSNMERLDGASVGKLICNLHKYSLNRNWQTLFLSTSVDEGIIRVIKVAY